VCIVWSVLRIYELASVIAGLTVGVTSRTQVSSSLLLNLSRVWIGISNIPLSVASRVSAFS
jgi:hypothetical protein